jgi:hypothetical protein
MAQNVYCSVTMWRTYIRPTYISNLWSWYTHNIYTKYMYTYTHAQYIHTYVQAYILICPSWWRWALMMEAASTSETSVNFYQTTRRNNPEDKSSYSPPWEPKISTPRFITVSTRARHRSLSWARWIQSTSSYLFSLWLIPTLYSHLTLVLPNGLLLSSFQTKSLLCRNLKGPEHFSVSERWTFNTGYKSVKWRPVWNGEMFKVPSDYPVGSWVSLCVYGPVKSFFIVDSVGHSGRAVWSVGLGRLVAGIVGSIPAQGMDVCPRLSVLCCPV